MEVKVETCCFSSISNDYLTTLTANTMLIADRTRFLIEVGSFVSFFTPNDLMNFGETVCVSPSAAGYQEAMLDFLRI